MRVCVRVCACEFAQELTSGCGPLASRNWGQCLAADDKYGVWAATAAPCAARPARAAGRTQCWKPTAWGGWESAGAGGLCLVGFSSQV